MIFAILKGLSIAVVASGAIAVGLILSQRPGALRDATGGLDFTGRDGATVSAPDPTGIAMRDGVLLPVRDYPNDNGPLLIMVHGSGWNGLQFSGLASDLQSDAHMLVPDLRGHGAQPERRGDVDYIGQLEDDLADLITSTRKPGQRVVLLGHSSGGGLVVRFAGGAHGALIDGAVLLAPFLKYNAPTTRPNSGGWARPLTRRIIGLSMLNAVGIRALNHLSVIEFNFPAAVLDGPLGHLATQSYSYRLNASYAPRSDYLKDISALPPFALIVGAEDEAFIAEAYAPVMQAQSDKGSYLIVPDQGHLSIVDAPQTAAAIRDMLNGL